MGNYKITTEKEALEAMKRDRCAFQYMPHELKTAKVCLEAVKKNCKAIKYVPEKLRDEVCRRLNKTETTLNGETIKRTVSEIANSTAWCLTHE